MTLPVVAPEGTGTTILAAPQLVGVVTVPLKLTVLVTCAVPKFAPVIVTEVPTAPAVGESVAMLGRGMPPAPEALNAAISAIQLRAGDMAQVTAITPAEFWI